MMSSHTGVAQPSAWLKRFAFTIPKEGLVLDLATGSGRHATHLAALGYRVLAVDRDLSAFESLDDSSIELMALDLEGEKWPLLNRQFQV